MPVAGNPPTPRNTPWFDQNAGIYHRVIDGNGQEGVTAFAVARGSRRYYGQVANRCILLSSLTASNKQQMSRSAHFAKEHINGVQVELPNYSISNTGTEVGTGGPASFTASIEYPAGVFTRCLFSGATTGVAQSKSKILTDFTAVNIPKGKKFWVKVWRADPLGIIYHGSNWFKDNAGQGDAFNFSTTTVPDTTMTTTATNLDATNIYTPSAIVGYTRYGSVMAVGDSLTAGQGDTPDASGDAGLFRFVGTANAWINFGRASDRAAWFLVDSDLRRDSAKWCSDIVIQHAINDLGSGAKTGAQVMASLIAIANLYRAAFPDKRIWVPTSTPTTTDATNVTPGATFAERVILNNLKRAVPAPFDGCLELADALENSRDGGLFAFTADDNDGTHINQSGYLRIPTTGFVDPASFIY